MNLFNTLLTPTNGIKLWCHWSMAGPLNKHAPLIRRLLFNSLWEIWRWRNKCCNILLLRPSVGIDVNASAERRGRWRGESHCIFLFAARAFWFFSPTAHTVAHIFCFFTHIACNIDRDAQAVCCFTHAACLFMHITCYSVRWTCSGSRIIVFRLLTKKRGDWIYLLQVFRCAVASL